MDIGGPYLYRPLLLLLMAVVALAGACGDDNGAAPHTPSPELTFQDSGGTAITLAAPPTRIVSYSPGATEILFAIGAGDRVIATDEFSDFPVAVQQLEKFAYSSPDPERALALAPDLLLMARGQRDQVEQFRSLGMTVFFIKESETVEGVIENIRLLGALTGNEKRAAGLMTKLRSRIDAVKEALDDVEQPPRVFFELTSDLYTAAPNTFVGDLLTLAKAQNIAADAQSSFPQLTAEAIIDADPEVVLLADGEFGESMGTVCARPGWDVVSACVGERVHPVDGDLTSRPGPRVVDGLELIARLLYPERFP